MTERTERSEGHEGMPSQHRVNRGATSSKRDLLEGGAEMTVSAEERG